MWPSLISSADLSLKGTFLPALPFLFYFLLSQKMILRFKCKFQLSVASLNCLEELSLCGAMHFAGHLLLSSQLLIDAFVSELLLLPFNRDDDIVPKCTELGIRLRFYLKPKFCLF